MLEEFACPSVGPVQYVYSEQYELPREGWGALPYHGSGWTSDEAKRWLNGSFGF